MKGKKPPFKVGDRILVDYVETGSDRPVHDEGYVTMILEEEDPIQVWGEWDDGITGFYPYDTGTDIVKCTKACTKCANALKCVKRGAYEG